jgi:hypothetical protein
MVGSVGLRGLRGLALQDAERHGAAAVKELRQKQYERELKKFRRGRRTRAPRQVQ